MDTTFAKGLRVIEVLAAAGEPMRLLDVAQAMGIQTSNAHRLLGTLSELGYVDREPRTSRYRLTLKLWELGAGVIARHPVRRVAMPFMQELHRVTGETVSLTVRDGDEVLYLDKLLSPRPNRFSTQPGSRAFAIYTVGGRVMIAHEPDAAEIVARAINSAGNTRNLAVGAVMEDIARARRDGFAVSLDPWRSGLSAIAAPIPSREGRAVAALTVSGPNQRFDEAAHPPAIEAAMHACARIAEAMGAV